jgi:hypothetical protein
MESGGAYPQRGLCAAVDGQQPGGQPPSFEGRECLFAQKHRLAAWPGLTPTYAGERPALPPLSAY